MSCLCLALSIIITTKKKSKSKSRGPNLQMNKNEDHGIRQATWVTGAHRMGCSRYVKRVAFVAACLSFMRLDLEPH